jgi:two-component system phosphate regulon response regulator PhoB
LETKRILVIEDEVDIAELIRYNLESSGFHVLALNEGRHILPHVRQFKPHIVLLDLMLPDVDGLDLCKRLKHDPSFNAIPIIMVTAKGTETDRIVGFELGADDYIVKPFSPRELILRVKAVISRTYPEPKDPEEDKQIIQKGPIKIDSQKHQVLVNNNPIDLTATEFKLLHDLILNSGKVRTREALLDKVWGYTFEGYARTVDTHIRRVRKKLDLAANFIETIRGVGYRFKDTV